MQCPKKLCKLGRLVWPGRSYIGRLSFDPAHNAPEPRISTAGHAYAEWGRDRNRNSIGNGRQPCLLVTNNLRCDRTAWESHRNLRPKPKDGIVPSLVNL